MNRPAEIRYLGGIAGCIKHHCRRRFDSLELLIEAGICSPLFSIFRVMDSLQQAIRDESDMIVLHACRLLSLCLEYTVLMEDVPGLRPLLRVGGAERICLATWRDTCERLATRSLYDVLLFIFEDLVLSQHVAVATVRYDGGVIRLRATMEEDRLRALVREPWKPGPAADTLSSGLSLMSGPGCQVAYTPRSEPGQHRNSLVHPRRASFTTL